MFGITGLMMALDIMNIFRYQFTLFEPFLFSSHLTSNHYL